MQSKKDFFKTQVKHIDITSFDSFEIIKAMKNMSFTARELAKATEIYNNMLMDQECTIILTIAGSTSAAGCMQLYADLIKYNMVDIIVATGATIVDMDFFEALGFQHFQGSFNVDDSLLRKYYVDRIYDTFIDELNLQKCDLVIKEIADNLPPKVYSSRQFIKQMGKYLTHYAKKENSLVQLAYENNVPIFCPAFSDSSAGLGLVLHQQKNINNHISIDSVKDLRELTLLKIYTPITGLFMIGGGVPKNFAQDIVICAELLGNKVPMHKYAVQISVADSRDGGCSGSTLKEASSWGKVNSSNQQMVFAEATSVLPLIVSYLFHRGYWKYRRKKELAKIL